ncbi:hypothetical protein BFU36_12820 [Sulfolobus sp. A20]|uniref:Lrp/AsnC family transcriptional regulator n=1 Tax=Sulfolobaceae TaxID=118883 RepID=UPI00084620EA|nr:MULTISPECIES: winged helix-turn-helix transcriptional regulator [unclassified Sulfolobus]TRM73778.1 hypothetical protein DJ532_14360 [Sulfolobus sp. A20-N-F8]TRM76759.1 hypothetical protein DJ523_00505 [Sulfolobus sp. E5]TRM79074.1 hypothetical protein DJ528_02820 [Sulfolobus sp. B5]TRM86146.1 hypothetical protein DJ529_11965 [Sulfolobus sp. C3]TRN01802.1 hypothetical protein DJ527_05010 [Sulfolobus sp. F1]
MLKLDELDLKILKRIQADGRFNLQNLAEEFKMPKSTILYRIRRMEKEGCVDNNFIHPHKIQFYSNLC